MSLAEANLSFPVHSLRMNNGREDGPSKVREVITIIIIDYKSFVPKILLVILLFLYFLLYNSNTIA